MRRDEPPRDAIDAALEAARQSPCMKSRRGVSVHRVLEIGAEKHRMGRVDVERIVIAHAIDLVADGYNSQPIAMGKSLAIAGAVGEAVMLCDGSSCRPSCGKVCVHAEVRAIRSAIAHASAARGVPTTTLDDCELVHVKVDDAGNLVAGGGPSCWQCSREILDVGLRGVWLYEKVMTRRAAAVAAILHPGDAWRFYEAREFHDVTLAECRRLGEIS